LRIEGVDNRKTGQFVRVEVRQGVVTVVAAWMLDASACAGMEIGAPRPSLAALRDLDDLLKRRRLGRSCSGDIAAIKEQPDANAAHEAFAAPPTADRVGFNATAGYEPGRSAPSRDAPRDPAGGSSLRPRRGARR
jgi:hypothetical protein